MILTRCWVPAIDQPSSWSTELRGHRSEITMVDARRIIALTMNGDLIVIGWITSTVIGQS